MNPLNNLTIVEASGALHNGERNARELLEQCLTVISDQNEKLNAVININPNALEEAKALDNAASSGGSNATKGRLHGIPLLVKDNIDVKGMPTTLCSPLFANQEPAGHDAGSIARLRAAGAVILGKTNMDELACHIGGITSNRRPTINPWRPGERLSPGGSSSGTAAAVAAGFCLGGLGSDTGGSIRIPAAWCGLVGLRPTPGRVSMARCYPRAVSLDVIGPIARTVEDAALLFSVLAGYPGAPLETITRGSAKPRIGLLKDGQFDNIEPETLDSLQRVKDNWQRLGATLVERDLAPFRDQEMVDALNAIRSHEFARDVSGDVEANRFQGDMHQVAAADYNRGRKVSAPEYRLALQKMCDLTSMVDNMLKELDFLLLPATYGPAIAVESPLEEFAKARAYVDLFSLTSVPTLVIPGPSGARGLPLGFQLVGRAGTDELLLEFGMRYEREFGPFPSAG